LNRELTGNTLFILENVSVSQEEGIIKMKKAMKVFGWSGLTVLLFIACSTPPRGDKVPEYSYRVVKTYPHDPSAFTEGLVYRNGILYEGTGLPGRSTLRKVDPETGRVLLLKKVPDKYFAEGITLFGNRVLQLTEDARFGYIYEIDDFTSAGKFPYQTRGWGITTDGKELILSDGSANLYFLDPDMYEETRRVEACDGKRPVTILNELEYAEGKIYANVWPTSRIVIISPATGLVTGWLDMKGLLSAQDRKMIDWSVLKGMNLSLPLEEEACLNGIAYDPESGHLFVTGKLWPKLFEIEITGEPR